LHYAAKRFYAPLILSVKHHGTEEAGVCNLVKRNAEVGVFSLFYSSQGESEVVDTYLYWSLLDVTTSTATQKGVISVLAQPDTSEKVAVLDLRASLAEVDVTKHVLLCSLKGRDGLVLSEATGWCCAPRFCELQDADIKIDVDALEPIGGSSISIRLTASSFAPFVHLDVRHDGVPVDAELDSFAPPPADKWSDNFFDLAPGVARTVSLRLAAGVEPSEALQKLQVKSLLDSYMC
jgi:beta-mannosidase